jgi:hypothetical protein
LSAILLGDFRWSEDPFDVGPGDTPEVDKLAALIRKHVEVQLITRDPTELLYGGRPVLSRELIEAAVPAKLGPLFPVVESCISSSVHHWWEIVVHVAPKLVIRAFIHDVFRSERVDLVPEEIWSRIARHHPEYARAVREAFQSSTITVEEWRAAACFVGYDGDGMDFLGAVRSMVLREY